MADPTQAHVMEMANLASAKGVDLSITIAVTMVTEMLAGSGLSDATKDNIKLFLACHFATIAQTQGALTESRIDTVLERYDSIYDKGLQATRFGQQAMLLDTSGILAAQASSVTKPNLPAQFSVISPPPVSDSELMDEF